MDAKTIARFWAKVERGRSDECWLWRGGKDKDGYGKVKHSGRHLRAHRVSWELAHGKIPSGLFVLHSCDTPSCVNPIHLFIGDNILNMKDMCLKGRKTRRRSLRAEWIPKIRKALQHGRSYSCIGRMYGVHAKAISQIAHGVTWKYF